MCSTCSSTWQPSALSEAPWQICCTRPRKLTQRCLLTTSQAAAQQTQLSQEETQKAWQYQIDRSIKQVPSAAPQQEQPSKEYKKELVKRQKSAREWITPWLVSLSNCLDTILTLGRCNTYVCLQTLKARSKSVGVMATLRTNDSGLSKHQQDTALKRLLGQSWQVQAVTVAHIKLDLAAPGEPVGQQCLCSVKLAPDRICCLFVPGRLHNYVVSYGNIAGCSCTSCSGG